MFRLAISKNYLYQERILKEKDRDGDDDDNVNAWLFYLCEMNTI